MTTQQQVAILFYVMLLEGARRYIAERISIHPITRCWLWVGCNDGRYGHAYYMGKRFKAHVLTFIIYRGKIPRGKILDHEKCDRTRCCCPYHLKPTTQSKNMKRCFAVGRGRSPFLREAN
jgi:hypothetical protein